MRAVYVGDDRAYWMTYLKSQRGGGAYYSGARLQRGAGLGSIFSSILRSIAPIAKAGFRAIKPIAKSAVKNLVKTGVSALGEVLAPDGGDPHAAMMQGLKGTAAQALQDTQRTFVSDDEEETQPPPPTTRRKKKQRGGGPVGMIKKHKRGSRVMGTIVKKKRAARRSVNYGAYPGF